MSTAAAVSPTPQPPRVITDLRARVRRLAERHTEIAIRKLMQKLLVLSTDTAAAIESTCETQGACARVVRSAYEALPREADSVGSLAQLLVLAQLREITRGVAPKPSSMGQPTAAELRASTCLHLHRAAALLLMKEVKASVWAAVIRGALLEAEALLLKIEEELTTADHEQLVRELEHAQQGPIDGDNRTSSLALVAEMLALEQLVRRLPREPEVPRFLSLAFLSAATGS